MDSKRKVAGKRLPRKVLRDKREFDNTFHPGVEAAELVHYVHNVRVGERQPYPGTIVRRPYDKARRMEEPTPLCHNCGWDTEHELDSGYTSRLKVFYIRGNSAIWELKRAGTWLLRDEASSDSGGGKKDYIVQQFIRKERPSVPLVEMHRFEDADRNFGFTIISRAKGKSLNAVWETATQEQKVDILDDLKKHIKEWRQITSPCMGMVDGSELRDCFIGSCTGYGCIKTGLNEEEWLENLTPALRKGILSTLWLHKRGWTMPQTILDTWVKEADEKVAQLKANFPRGGPYVLTHADLHGENIFVSDDNEEKKFKISAIIDWELAGFYPWWVEPYRRRLPNDLYLVLGEDSDILHPGYTAQEFFDIYKAVQNMEEAWSDGGYHGASMHGLAEANIWRRKPFCACKPYAGKIRDSSMGWDQEHRDIFDIDSTDSEDETPDECLKFDKIDRSFMRWFKTLNIPE